MQKVRANDIILVHYTGKYDNGEIFESTEDKAPVRFELGKGKLITGFEKGFVGLSIGQKQTLNIPFKDAYGPVNEKLFRTIHKSDLPKEVNLKIGEALVAQNANGQKHHVFIKAIDEMTITVDANHPLAGKDLIFEVEVVEIVFVKK